jgi:hypothetical protein
VKIRFDAWFYLAPAPAGAEARADGSEVVDARWYEPAAALAARERGELFLVFPTIKHLQQLSGFASADDLLAHASGREVHPVEPRVLLQGETARIVLPGEPGYEDPPPVGESGAPAWPSGAAPARPPARPLRILRQRGKPATRRPRDGERQLPRLLRPSHERSSLWAVHNCPSGRAGTLAIYLSYVQAERQSLARPKSRARRQL